MNKEQEQLVDELLAFIRETIDERTQQQGYPEVVGLNIGEEVADRLKEGYGMRLMELGDTGE